MRYVRKNKVAKICVSIFCILILLTGFAFLSRITDNFKNFSSEAMKTSIQEISKTQNKPNVPNEVQEQVENNGK